METIYKIRSDFEIASDITVAYLSQRSGSTLSIHDMTKAYESIFETIKGCRETMLDQKKSCPEQHSEQPEKTKG